MRRLSGLGVASMVGTCLFAVASACNAEVTLDLQRFTRIAFQPIGEEEVLEEEAPQLPQADARPKFIVSAEGYATYRTSGGVEETDGSLAIGRTGAEVGVLAFVGDNLTLRGSFAGEYTRFDFSDVPQFIQGVDDLIDNTYSMFLSGFAELQLNETWSIVGGGSVSWGWEDGASLDSAVWGAAYVAGGYRFSDQFKLTLGAGVVSRLDDNAFIIPFVGFEWLIDDKSKLTGNGVTFQYTRELTPEWDLFVKSGWRLRQYRLNDEKVLVPRGTASDFWVPLTLGVAWKPTRNVEVSLEGGAVVYEFIRFRTEGGVDRETRRIDPGALFELRVTLRF